MSNNTSNNEVCELSSDSIVLITGASRSGKSKWGEYLIRNHNNVCYVATFRNNYKDPTWTERVRLHKLRRPDNWKLIESAEDLIKSINNLHNHTLLIDSLGGFVFSNLELKDNDWINLHNKFIDFIIQYQQPIVIVIEETGWGVVPASSSGILFSDRIGQLSQLLQKIATQSWLVVQGRAVNLSKYGILIP